MIIEVTQEDIDNGVRSDCHACPVANAIGRAFPTKNVSVFPGIAEFDTGEDILLPRSVTDFILDFDNGRPVQPFRFTMRRP